MKKKMIYIFTIVCVFITCLGIGQRETSSSIRYHQHLHEDIDDLPIINIDTNGQKIPGSPIPSNSGNYELSEDGNETIVASLEVKGQDSINSKITLRYRGN